MAYKSPPVTMKRIIMLSISLLFTISGFSQEKIFPKNTNNEYEFSEVIETGLSKQILFANALSWAMSTYENYKSIVQVESEIDGRLVIKTNNLILYNLKDYPNRTVERVFYVLTIDCKENKYRYVFSNIKIEDISPNKYSMFMGEDIGWDVTHEQHQIKIKELKETKSNIEEQMQNANDTLKGSKLKKSISKLQKQLNDINSQLEKEEFLYNDEFNIFDRLINSLKKKMSVNTDF